MRKMNKYYLGIDPGVNGGLGVIRYDGKPMEWIKMPDNRHKIIDRLTMMNQLYRDLLLIIELAQPMPKQGIVSSFNYGRHFGLFEAAAIMLKIPYHEVRPAIWKKAMGLTSKKIDSISKCQNLFPMVDLIPSGCKTHHHGMAEALLIAEWGRRKNL